MKEDFNFDLKVESISNIDDLVSWWKRANHEDQSKYDLFNEAISKYGINVEKLALYCNKKIIEIDDKTREYQTHWKVLTLTLIPGCFLPLFPSFQNFIFKIYEQENIEDVSILFNGLGSYYSLISMFLVLLFFIYIVGVIFIKIICRFCTNRKTYYSLFTLSNNSMIF